MPTADLIAAAARRYLAAELCVLPAVRAEKRPAVARWARYRTQRPTLAELEVWLARNPDAICIVCGVPSGNLECIDFDGGGELFPAWRDTVPIALRGRVVMADTPSGGKHVIYRCEAPVDGNLKLARRANKTLIETRGDGGLFLCAPSPGYVVFSGDLAAPPTFTAAERDTLLRAARALDEQAEPPKPPPLPAMPSGRPGDEYNARGDVRGALQAAGWVPVAVVDGNERWRRPGKSEGWSATLREGSFYVFSSNAAPFEPDRAYSPYAVYTMLHHGGDFAAAAATLAAEGYSGTSGEIPGVDIAAIIPATPADGGEPEPVEEIQDPGPVPEALLRIPGLVSEIMDYTLATAPYPNQALAFTGAVAMQAFLAGRKVRDPGDNRTNLYLLALAGSSVGKDQPRKTNVQIANSIGIMNGVGDRFSSGEGVQDALLINPNMLFQTDEIDGLLQSINRSPDARYESTMGTLLTLYTSANSVFPVRRRAGQEYPGVIDQPCLTLYGTAIPEHYYSALSDRMLTNGLFARMMIVEAGSRCGGCEPRIKPLPPRIIEAAKWWATFQSSPGNLITEHPTPVIIEQTEPAQLALAAMRERADAAYTEAEGEGDVPGTTVWGRVSEHVRKMALLYAVSESRTSPLIGEPAVRWATALVEHQAMRMLYMAATHVAQSLFHAQCLKFMNRLRRAPGRAMSHQQALRTTRVDMQSFSRMVETLSQQEDIKIELRATTTRPGRWYVAR